MKRIGFALIMLFVTAETVAAQQVSQRVIDAQPAKWQVPLCNLRGNKATDNGLKALKKAIEEKDVAKRAEAFGEARTTLMAATAETPDNAAGWYYLGRYYLYQGDMAGLDAAWKKTIELNDSCEIDINGTRQNTWATLANAGIDFLRQDQTDSALVLFGQANTIFRDLPHVLLQTGGILANRGQEDSAAVYLAEAAEVAARDTTYVEEQRSAELNLAVVQQRLERYPEAVKTLRHYLSWNPGDTDAQRSLAIAFRGANMPDSAATVDASLVAAFSAMNTDSLGVSDLMAVGVGYFNAEKYEQASTIFSKIVARSPFSRDGLYNLANSYFALKNFEGLAMTAEKLLVVEPMSADALQLLGQAQREMKLEAEMIKTAEKLIGLPFSLEVAGFQLGETSARLTATATGRAAMDARGTVLPLAPITLVVEFLGDGGAVVVAEEVTIPALEPGASHDIRLDGAGAGIQSWRYKRKG